VRVQSGKMGLEERQTNKADLFNGKKRQGRKGGASLLATGKNCVAGEDGPSQFGGRKVKREGVTSERT